jgi:hypothetical protein
VKAFRHITWILFASFLIAACGKESSDKTGPSISDIKASGNVLVISDCSGTSVSVTAKVTDPSGVNEVLFWYRVADQPFASREMAMRDGIYEVSVQGSEFLGKGYGPMEFYVQAEDKAGNVSRSPVDQSVQFLPCVSN